MNLTAIEQNIINTLPVGEAKSITYKVLAWRVNMNDRDLRRTVAHLVKDHHVCICTVSSGGYFLASNFEEYDHAHKELVKRGLECFRRAKGLKFGWKKDCNREKQLSLGGM